MAFEKFALNLTLIDHIVYEIITNQFNLTNNCASNLSL